jgi:hypothetical protein
MDMLQAVVCNGKIEIQAPFECKEGQVVSIILFNNSSLSDPLSGDERENALRVLEDFTSTFSSNSSQEDLSDVARQFGEIEISHAMKNFNQKKGFFE